MSQRAAANASSAIATPTADALNTEAPTTPALTRSFPVLAAARRERISIHQLAIAGADTPDRKAQPQRANDAAVVSASRLFSIRKVIACLLQTANAHPGVAHITHLSAVRICKVVRRA
jgi:hypothetical protein